MLRNFISFILLFSLQPTLTCLAENLSADPSYPIWVQTELNDPELNTRFEIIAGEIYQPSDLIELQHYFKEKASQARNQNPNVYLEVNEFRLDETNREPSSKKAKKHSPWKKLKNFLSKNFHSIKIRPTISVFKKQKNLYKQLKHPNHRMQLSFAIIAASVDGSTTTLSLALFEGAGLASALTVGGTVAILSGSWSLFTPQIALFLNGKPSLVDQIVQKKTGFKTPAKWIEGLFKWGLVQSTFLGVISGVSAATGVMDFTSLSDWALRVVKTSALVTAGQGIFDYSLSVELDRSIRNEPHPQGQRKTLLRTYVLGTAAASAAALGGIASLMGVDFGNILLYGLLGGGVINLARIHKEEVKAFFGKISNHCKNLLKPTPGSVFSRPSQAYWGSE
jgi:hypothetical protein